jgi:putative ABC transport system permease protein|tara:strand:- start:5074 stop:6234 length:1161 start_codon:yes stop_codon:yes gene_type:complete
MKYWIIILAALNRKRWRTGLTISSLVIAFLLFGLLRSVAVVFTEDIELSGDDRLVVASKYSIIDSMPISYLQRIKSIENVDIVAHQDWFGGTYIDRANFFPKWPVPPKDFLDIYQEFNISSVQKEAFITTRTGMIAGKKLAERFNWKIGDRIPVIGDIYFMSNGSNLWEFDLVGIFTDIENPGNEEQVFMNYQYFDEARESYTKGTVGNFIVKLDSKDAGPRVAQEIDAMFANSMDETKTYTEKAYQQMFASQIGDIGLIMNSILAAVFFTILLVTGNTMSQSIRERTSELAVFKTIGFSDMTMLILVLIESMVLCLIGAILGLGITGLLMPGLSELISVSLGEISLDSSVIISGIGIAIITAFISGFPPALGAMRLKVVDALRKD